MQGARNCRLSLFMKRWVCRVGRGGFWCSVSSFWWERERGKCCQRNYKPESEWLRMDLEKGMDRDRDWPAIGDGLGSGITSNDGLAGWEEEGTNSKVEVPKWWAGSGRSTKPDELAQRT